MPEIEGSGANPMAKLGRQENISRKPVIDLFMRSCSSHCPVIDPVIDPRMIMRTINDWIAHSGFTLLAYAHMLFIIKHAEIQNKSSNISYIQNKP